MLTILLLLTLGLTGHAVNGRSLLAKDGNMTKVYLDQDAKIYNGLKATPGQFPYQVLLLIPKDSNQSICGGTLISERWVLTAAHCVFGTGLPTVYLGLTDIVKRASATQINASKIVVFPAYKNIRNLLRNDIALVRLSMDAPLSRTIQIAELPPLRMKRPASIDRQMLFISGFGETGPSGTYLEDHSKTWPLKYNKVKMFIYRDCKARTKINKIVCVDRRNVNSGICQGDSGGPLSQKLTSGKGRVYGVTSFLIGNCQDPNPAAFTYVGSYLQWIKATSGVVPPVI